MTPAVDCSLLLLALFGHVAVWVAIFNRVHAFPWPCWLVRVSERLAVLICWAIMGWFCWNYSSVWQVPMWLTTSSKLSTGWQIYLILCLLQACRIFVLWVRWKLSPAAPPALLSTDSHIVNVAEQCPELPVGKRKTRWQASLPGNEILTLEVNRKELALPRLSPDNDGLTITHLSDLHFTGQLTPPFFANVVAEANALGSDIIMITGDIVDKQPCLDWIPEILGQLVASQGVYGILGNHDKRICDVQQVRQALHQAGIVDVGGTFRQFSIQGQSILLAGNELPWFPWQPPSPLPDRSENQLRILMSHTPDQIQWARARAFDLMLAGHNHGGQVRIPVIGPIATPSWYGTRYACGVFDESPTLLHVSRGISGVHTLRYWCRPEVTQITLRRSEP